MTETTTAVNESTNETGSIFDTLTSGFQGIIDLIMSIINMIRSAVENIVGE